MPNYRWSRPALASIVLLLVTTIGAAQERRRVTPETGLRIPPTGPRPAPAKPGRSPDLHCQVSIYYRGWVIENGGKFVWGSEEAGWGGLSSRDPTFLVRANLMNRGSDEATFTYSVGIRTDGAKAPSSTSGQTTLAAKQSKMLAPFPVSVAKNVLKITATGIVDVGNFVPESDESNNVCKWEVNKSEGEDSLWITAGKAIAPARKCGGASLVPGRLGFCPPLVPVADWVEVKVKNHSTLDTSKPFWVNVLVAEDACNGEFKIPGIPLSPGREIELKARFPKIPGFAGCDAFAKDGSSYKVSFQLEFEKYSFANALTTPVKFEINPAQWWNP